jgi:hypothetical protein
MVEESPSTYQLDIALLLWVDSEDLLFVAEGAFVLVVHGLFAEEGVLFEEPLGEGEVLPFDALGFSSSEAEVEGFERLGLRQAFLGDGPGLEVSSAIPIGLPRCL